MPNSIFSFGALYSGELLLQFPNCSMIRVDPSHAVLSGYILHFLHYFLSFLESFFRHIYAVYKTSTMIILRRVFRLLR